MFYLRQIRFHRDHLHTAENLELHDRLVIKCRCLGRKMSQQQINLILHASWAQFNVQKMPLLTQKCLLMLSNPSLFCHTSHFFFFFCIFLVFDVIQRWILAVVQWCRSMCYHSLIYAGMLQVCLNFVATSGLFSPLVCSNSPALQTSGWKCNLTSWSRMG